jgi:hypothetical protein
MIIGNQPFDYFKMNPKPTILGAQFHHTPLKPPANQLQQQQPQIANNQSYSSMSMSHQPNRDTPSSMDIIRHKSVMGMPLKPPVSAVVTKQAPFQPQQLQQPFMTQTPTPLFLNPSQVQPIFIIPTPTANNGMMLPPQPVVASNQPFFYNPMSTPTIFFYPQPTPLFQPNNTNNTMPIPFLPLRSNNNSALGI